MRVTIDDPRRDDVATLLLEHLSDMHATSPPESIHALDLEALTGAGITFVTARDGDVLLGCGALKELDPEHGEIKSMRTTSAACGRGVGAAVLTWLLEEGRTRGLRRISLETGTQDYFTAAHRLYERHGFVDCEPFADYRLDPHSRFMTIALD